MKHKYITMALILLAIGFRLYHIEFGLPQSFYADEPEISEPAILHTYEFRNVIKNNDYYKFFPVSFVYGTLPVYIMTLCLMAFSKTLNILGIGIDKMIIYVFLRVVTVFISLGVVAVTVALAKKHFENTKIVLTTLALVGLNWKLIVLSHYTNADIVLALMLLLSFYTFWLYDKNPVGKNLIITGIFFGLAVGTKVTALISLPLFLYFIWKKNDRYGIFGFIFSAIAAFMVSNPFSVILFGEFTGRIATMLTKEAGMVFDSVDYNPFKYILALTTIVTLPVLLASIYGFFHKLRESQEKNFDIFMLANIVLYLLFFSIQSRRVDRWLLPITPLVLIYASYGLWQIYEMLRNPMYKKILVAVVTVVYMLFPLLLLTQFQRWTPKAAAYLWADQNLEETKTKLVYTEEGLDPMNKLGLARVLKFQVYESDGAAEFYPENPMAYDYVILSSRPMENFKRPEVKEKYAYYVYRWETFENIVLDKRYFEIVKDFTLTKPNLIPLSDVVIYKRI